MRYIHTPTHIYIYIYIYICVHVYLYIYTYTWNLIRSINFCPPLCLCLKFWFVPFIGGSYLKSYWSSSSLKIERFLILAVLAASLWRGRLRASGVRPPMYVCALAARCRWQGCRPTSDSHKLLQQVRMQLMASFFNLFEVSPPFFYAAVPACLPQEGTCGMKSWLFDPMLRSSIC